MVNLFHFLSTYQDYVLCITEMMTGIHGMERLIGQCPVAFARISIEE